MCFIHLVCSAALPRCQHNPAKVEAITRMALVWGHALRWEHMFPLPHATTATPATHGVKDGGWDTLDTGEVDVVVRKPTVALAQQPAASVIDCVPCGPAAGED